MKRILVFSFFPAFVPATSGGEQRLYWLYRHLSQFHDVTLLSHTHPGGEDQLIEHSGHFRELRVPKDEIFLELHAQMAAEGIGPECSALVCALAGERGGTRYHKRAEDLVGTADVVIHESPYTLPFDADFDNPRRSWRLYNSYNIEYLLAPSVFGGPRADRYYVAIQALERKLALHSDIVFATCEGDAKGFSDLFGVSRNRIHIAHNGVEPFWSAPIVNRSNGAAKPVVAFLGSGNHPPNVEAARLIIGKVAAQTPEMEFHIVGSVCQRLGDLQIPSNVFLRGILSEEQKRDLLAFSACGLNPMVSGGGTNLKMLEYLASGMAVVTTPVGARGLEIQDGVHAVICEPDAMPAALRGLASAPERRLALGVAGRAHVTRYFTWASAARAVRQAIKDLAEADRGHCYVGRPVNLLLLNDFPVTDGLGGGQVRIREVYRALPDGFEMVLLCLHDGDDEEVTRVDHRFVQIAVPKTREHRREQDRSVIADVSIGDIVSGRHCLRNQRYREVLRKHLALTDVVVFEHPYLAPLLDDVPLQKPVVYSSLNVETEIKRELLEGRPDYARCIREVAASETALSERAALIVTVTELDASYFRARYPDRVVVHVANGTDCGPHLPLLRFSRLKERFSGHPVVAFVGSAHPPNIVAARFVVGTLARELPEVYFLLIGTVCEAIGDLRTPANVLLAGRVSLEEKEVLQGLSQIGINPVTEGGGSSLKVPDALAAGKPLLSTLFGARGFYADGCEGIVLAELDQFAERLRELLAKPAMLRKLSNDAVRHARGRLDWPVVVEQYAVELRKLIGAPSTAALSGRRLLVVTHRYTQPPRGGAEHYLDQVLARLGRSGRWSVSVATVDGTDIRNQWQFSAAFSDDGTQCGEHPSYLDRLYKFQITGSDPSDIFASCRRLYELWAMESVRLGRLALATLAPPDPVLLGGWYLPEVVGTRAGRWSTPEAELFLPVIAGETRITVNGFALESKRLLIKLGGQAVSETVVPAGSFAVSVTVAAEGPGILALCTSGTITSADPRALGVFIDALSYGDAQQVCFDTDLLDAWQTQDAEGWISALAALTMERSREVDELFSQTRGPQSDPLRRWLFDHIDAFDVVLAHELPFSTLTLAADVAYECGVPCVLLPHIHVEDRYYHWQSYVRAFRQATLTMVAPYPAKALYFDKISGVRSVAVAGGGIDVAEFGGDIGACRAAFRNKYGSPDPFVLVLGRKSGAKRYSLVIEGVERARAWHPRLRVVMIGPDEDGQRIDASYVSYLGPQPRAVVLGALHECIVLANMSQSESFGIVILEAWMAGKPVVVNRNCLAFQELVVSGRDGWLCQSAADLAEAFSAVLDSPARSMKMGEAGRRKAGEYSWDRVAEQIEGALAIRLEERAC